MNNFKIHVELVPRTCWFTNVRSQVSKKDWDILRKQAYEKAQHRCSICNADRKLEAHEIWHYNDETNVQKLDSIVAVCKSCHELYHLGFASIQGNLPKAMKWLSKVNSWDEFATKEYVDIVFEIWYRRSQKQWKLDLSYLDNQNVKYSTISKKERIELSSNFKKT